MKCLCFLATVITLCIVYTSTAKGDPLPQSTLAFASPVSNEKTNEVEAIKVKKKLPQSTIVCGLCPCGCNEGGDCTCVVKSATTMLKAWKTSDGSVHFIDKNGIPTEIKASANCTPQQLQVILSGQSTSSTCQECTQSIPVQNVYTQQPQYAIQQPQQPQPVTYQTFGPTYTTSGTGAQCSGDQCPSSSSRGWKAR